MFRPPIKGFVKESFTDWPGQTCAVISLPYCNLRCPYCHSHELVLKPDALEPFAFETIIQDLESKKDSIYGICVTGGEPTIHRGLPGLLRTIREAGYKTKVDTNGTEPEVLEHLIEHRLLDLVAVDIKAPLDETAYERCAGVFVPVSIIEKSIEIITAAGVAHLFRCTVVPSLLAEDDIYRLAEGLKSRVGTHGAPCLILQDFDPTDTLEPALKDVKPLPKETLCRMQERVDRILA